MELSKTKKAWMEEKSKESFEQEKRVRSTRSKVVRTFVFICCLI